MERYSSVTGTNRIEILGRAMHHILARCGEFPSRKAPGQGLSARLGPAGRPQFRPRFRRPVMLPFRPKTLPKLFSPAVGIWLRGVWHKHFHLPVCGGRGLDHLRGLTHAGEISLPHMAFVELRLSLLTLYFLQLSPQAEWLKLSAGREISVEMAFVARRGSIGGRRFPSRPKPRSNLDAFKTRISRFAYCQAGRIGVVRLVVVAARASPR